MYTVQRMKIKVNLIVILTFFMVALSGCSRFPRDYYVGELDLNVTIENRGDNRYRIYVYRTQELKGADYIDVIYYMSEMPSITMVFPLDDSNNIYIIDQFYGEIKSNSKQFNIVYPEFNRNERNERLAYRNWCDSLIKDDNSINVRLGSYLRNLDVWDGNGIFDKSVSSYDKFF